ncbi:hypothetical protein ABZ746_37600 [Streptomyces sp. NPDC020096]
MTDLKTPSSHDFQTYADLVGKQGGHFDVLNKWAGDQCKNADGLDGLLYPLRDAVTSASGFFTGKLAQCDRGMGVIADKIHKTSTDYTTHDQNMAKNIRSLYPTPIAHFPDIGADPNLPHMGEFTDESVKLKEPTGAEKDTAKNIEHQIWAIQAKLKGGGELAAAEHIYKLCTGHSLIEQLVHPLLGDYGRLLYLHGAYSELSDGIYTVAATLRKGSWALADEWIGEAATAFDSYMFQWTMGIGGVGDTAKEAADIYKAGYGVVIGLVYAALAKIDKLMADELHRLEKEALEMGATDLSIEAIGLGPEDPLADIGVGLYTGYKMYKIYKEVKKVVTIISVITDIYKAISAAVAGMSKAIHGLKQFIDSPMTLPTVGSLINDVEQHGFRFEQSGAWNATAGASRIKMLPQA